MLTQTFNKEEETGDLISYAKWFSINDLKFCLHMHSTDDWTAETEFLAFKIETTHVDGPVKALALLHGLVRPIVAELKK